MEIGCSMVADALIAALGCTSAMAQQITGVPSSPAATHHLQTTPAARPRIRWGDQGERSLGFEYPVGSARAARILADLI
jgi:hypothetical protein